jgi:metal-responsive CopG/Arc/MetJ family transcriptional regulator
MTPLLPGITLVILRNMKTAISIPDGLFESAEGFARRQGMSRSELYASALREYLAEHKAEGITERLDAIYAEELAEESRLDPALERMQAESIPAQDDW